MNQQTPNNVKEQTPVENQKVESVFDRAVKPGKHWMQKLNLTPKQRAANTFRKVRRRSDFKNRWDRPQPGTGKLPLWKFVAKHAPQNHEEA